MNAKKKRTKNQRRARKLANQAWEAADDGNCPLAVKIVQRAVESDPGNPVLRNDQGLLLQLSGAEGQAAEAFQAAVSLAPNYAEAFAHLAAIRLRQGLLREAVAIQQQAVRYSPGSGQYRESLTAYQAMIGDVGTNQKQPVHYEYCGVENSLRLEYADLTKTIDDLGWGQLETSLTRQGFCKIPGVFTAKTCGALRNMFHNDDLFAKTVVMNKESFGDGVYRYFASPIPELVDAIRRIVYPHVASIANNWQRLLGEDASFPAVWEGFRQRCAEFGQSTPTPILLRYEAGGFNDLHRDIRGEVFFPIQMAIVLSNLVDTSSDKDGFQGGNFLFCDDPPRKKSHCRAIPAGLGDVVLFCTRGRLVPIAGVYGWQAVKHGVDHIVAGTRYVLGVPFHEYE